MEDLFQFLIMAMMVLVISVFAAARKITKKYKLLQTEVTNMNKLLEAMTLPTGVAIENARLYEKLQHSIQQSSGLNGVEE